VISLQDKYTNMNKRIISAFLIIAFLSLTNFATDSSMQSNQVTTELTEALSKANARDVAKHFGATVDLKLPGNEGTYSKNQAELILRNFFTRNVPESFAIQHQGPSRDGSVYAIGVYKSQNGKTFRTYFLLKKISDQMVLHLLQLEEQ
jgi:hypothetical protein